MSSRSTSAKICCLWPLVWCGSTAAGECWRTQCLWRRLRIKVRTWLSSSSMSRPSLTSSKLIRKLGNLSLMINSTQPMYLQATSSGRSSQSSPRALEASARGKASVTSDWCKDLLTLEVVCFRTTWVTWSTKGTRRGFYSCGSSVRLNWRATSRKIGRISWSPCGPSCSRRSSWASGARLSRIDDLIR